MKSLIKAFGLITILLMIIPIIPIRAELPVPNDSNSVVHEEFERGPYICVTPYVNLTHICIYATASLSGTLLPGNPTNSLNLTFTINEASLGVARWNGGYKNGWGTSYAFDSLNIQFISIDYQNFNNIPTVNESNIQNDKHLSILTSLSFPNLRSNEFIYSNYYISKSVLVNDIQTGSETNNTEFYANFFGNCSIATFYSSNDTVINFTAISFDSLDYAVVNFPVIQPVILPFTFTNLIYIVLVLLPLWPFLIVKLKKLSLWSILIAKLKQLPIKR